MWFQYPVLGYRWEYLRRFHPRLEGATIGSFKFTLIPPRVHRANVEAENREPQLHQTRCFMFTAPPRPVESDASYPEFVWGRYPHSRCTQTPRGQIRNRATMSGYGEQAFSEYEMIMT